MAKKVSHLGKVEASTQTVRKSAQEEKLHKSYHDLLSQQVFDAENDKRLQREVPVLVDRVDELQKKVELLDSHNKTLTKELDQERTLRRNKEELIGVEAEQIATLQEENRKLKVEAQQMKTRQPQLLEMHQQLVAEATLVFLESEVNGRERMVFSERKERFDLMSSLMEIFM